MTIYKYVLESPAETINLPAGAKPLSVGVQGSQVVLWVLLDPKATEHKLRTFETYGTGWDVPDAEGLVPVGTVQLPNGLVFHVFERTR